MAFEPASNPSQGFASIPLRVAGLLFKGRLARASLWLLVSNLATGVLGYAYQIVMGRMLPPADYGLLSAMVALGVILPVPLGAAMLILTRKFSEYRARGEDGRVSQLWIEASRWIDRSGIVVVLLYLLLAPLIRDYLGVPSLWPIYLMGTWVLVLIFSGLHTALLQGMQSFSWLGGGTLLTAVVKIVASVLLVAAGYGIYGALFGLLLASIAMWVSFNWASREYRCTPPVNGGHRFTIRDTWPIVAATVAFTLMTQLDMVLVRHYFDAHDAGIYAAASTLGKAVMYLPGAIVIALFPMVAENDARSEGSAHLLVQAVLLVGTLSGCGTLLFLFFPDFLIHLFYGEAYAASAEVLRYFGFAMLPTAFVLVAEHFLIAKGRVLFVYLFVLVAPAQVIAVSIFHATLLDVVKVMIVCSSFLMLIGYSMLWREYRKSA